MCSQGNVQLHFNLAYKKPSSWTCTCAHDKLSSTIHLTSAKYCTKQCLWMRKTEINSEQLSTNLYLEDV